MSTPQSRALSCPKPGCFGHRCSCNSGAVGIPLGQGNGEWIASHRPTGLAKVVLFGATAKVPIAMRCRGDEMHLRGGGGHLAPLLGRVGAQLLEAPIQFQAYARVKHGGLLDGCLAPVKILGIHPRG